MGYRVPMSSGSESHSQLSWGGSRGRPAASSIRSSDARLPWSVRLHNPHTRRGLLLVHHLSRQKLDILLLLSDFIKILHITHVISVECYLMLAVELRYWLTRSPFKLWTLLRLLRPEGDRLPCRNTQIEVM